MGGYSVPINKIAGGMLTPAAHLLSPRRFRFIVCSDFLSNGLLNVLEYPTLPCAQTPYAAVSYPWNGLKPYEGCASDESAFFRVHLEGGLPSDPISIATLRTACLAAQLHKTNLLWVDQVCIMQTNTDDKVWQVQRMFSLYKNCTVSLVFPGGLRRLAQHDEGTNWIERTWTLQEAMPEATHVVFGWPRGSGKVGGLSQGYIQEVEKGQTAMMKLGPMLQAAYITWSHFDDGVGQNKIHIAIFGPNRDPILALMAVKEAKSTEMQEMAVWRSAMLRTCSVARDMILSIMGIFDVELEVERYGANDRDKAAADLVFEIVNRGGNASWLGAAPGCAIRPSMCSLPEFPLVDGREVWYLVDGERKRPWNVMGTSLAWYVKPTSKAAIEKKGSGRLHLTAKTLRVKLGPSKPSQSSFWPGFGFEALLRLDEGTESGRSVDDFHIARPLPGGDYQALVVGRMEHFQLTATAARAQKEAALLAILRWNHATDGWEMLSYATTALIQDVARTWPRCVLPIGC